MVQLSVAKLVKEEFALNNTVVVAPSTATTLGRHAWLQVPTQPQRYPVTLEYARTARSKEWNGLGVERDGSGTGWERSGCRYPGPPPSISRLSVSSLISLPP